MKHPSIPVAGAAPVQMFQRGAGAPSWLTVRWET